MIPFAFWHWTTSAEDEPIVPITWPQAAGAIGDGDVLLFRSDGAVARAGRGRHSHAALAGWWDDTLFCLETRLVRGARAVCLENLVAQMPGRIDWFQATVGDRRARRAAVRWMGRLTGKPYGLARLLALASAHAPIVRWLVPPRTNDRHRRAKPPVCSQAVAEAWRIGGGIDLVPHLADAWTEPADLARSAFLRYRGTLVWDPHDLPVDTAGTAAVA
ncbi:hypothetical protein JCM19992_02600 [Thermostilla marina]